MTVDLILSLSESQSNFWIILYICSWRLMKITWLMQIKFRVGFCKKHGFLFLSAHSSLSFPNLHKQRSATLIMQRFSHYFPNFRIHTVFKKFFLRDFEVQRAALHFVPTEGPEWVLMAWSWPTWAWEIYCSHLLKSSALECGILEIPVSLIPKLLKSELGANIDV